MAALHELLRGEDRQTLADLGFMALGQGRPDVAATLFEGLDALAPEGGTAKEAAAIGLGMARVAQGRAAEAVALLRAAPPSEGVSLYLAIALTGVGANGEARQILEDIIALGADPAHVQVARATLEGMGE